MCFVSILNALSEYTCLSMSRKESKGTPSVCEEKLTTRCSFSLKLWEKRASKYCEREARMTWWQWIDVPSKIRVMSEKSG